MSASATAEAKTPPDERFWKRYSPHHELPISSATSAGLHASVLALLVVVAAVLANRGPGGRPMPPVEVLVVGTSKGDGGPGGAGQGILARGQERVGPEADQPKVDEDVPHEPLRPPQAKLPPLMPEKDERRDGRGISEQTQELSNRLSVLGRETREKLDRLTRKSGVPGGEGPEDGPGKPGRRGRLDPRQQRQLRWTMVFNTRDGGDYLRQLDALGAFLAIPGTDGRYRLVRNLKQRPAVPKEEDLSEINRINWIDDRAPSAQALAYALGLSWKPDHVVAFFPDRLEKELLAKELAHLRRTDPKRTEDDILETSFAIRPAGPRGYEAVVVSQRLK
jgi:hypothetical protein